MFQLDNGLRYYKSWDAQKRHHDSQQRDNQLHHDNHYQHLHNSFPVAHWD